jgi:hypothetical protein
MQSNLILKWGVFLLMLLGCATTASEDPEISTEPKVWQDLKQTTFSICFPNFYDEEVNKVCTDTLEGFVADVHPFDEYGISLDSTAVYHLHVIDKRIFAATEGGQLWTKIHQDEKWILLNPADEFLVVLPGPFFQYDGLDYLLTRGGDVYELNENGLGKKSKMNLPKDWCVEGRTCYVSKITSYKEDLYLYTYLSHSYDAVGNSTFLYKSSDKGLNWTSVENYPGGEYWSISDWQEYDGYLYLIQGGENLWRYDGNEFVSFWYNDTASFDPRVFKYNSLQVHQGNLYTGSGGELLQIKELETTKVFDGFTTHTILDTVCNNLVNASPGDYWNPETMPIQNIRAPSSWTSGYQDLFGAVDHYAFLNTKLLNQMFSPKRIGDTLYFGTNNRRRDGEIPEPGSVVFINLRNFKICPDAWERGETIGGRTKWGGFVIER